MWLARWGYPCPGTTPGSKLSVPAISPTVAFYVQQFNEVLPHSALKGRTPDEAYFGQAENIPVELATARKVARAERLDANRALSCAACTASGTPDANHVSAA